MLVLSRKAGERISIGSDIEVVVLSVHNGRVKLGLAGPREIPIHRGEVSRRISEELSAGFPAPLLAVSCEAA